MLWRQVVSFFVMTVAVQSHAADGMITRGSPSTIARSEIIDVTAHVGGGSSQTEASAGSKPLYDFLVHRDAGLGSIATSAYEVHTQNGLDSWLMLLVAGGLVVLQLRRKQKTLPQRPLIESDNKLYWG